MNSERFAASSLVSKYRVVIDRFDMTLIKGLVSSIRVHIDPPDHCHVDVLHKIPFVPAIHHCLTCGQCNGDPSSQSGIVQPYEAAARDQNS